MNTPAGHALHDLLPALRPRLEALIDAPAWTACEELLAGLPPSWTWGCLEARLAAGERRVDISVGTLVDGPERRILAEALAAGATPALDGPLRPCLEAWTSPGNVFHDGVTELWIEWDLPQGRIEAPFVFYRLPGGHASASGVALVLVEESLRLTGRRLDAERRKSLERCFRALPEDGRIVYAAGLPARRGGAVPSRAIPEDVADLRIIARLPEEDVSPWLAALGWPGGARRGRIVRELLASLDAEQYVCLDVGASVGPALALEHLITPGAAAPERWTRLVESLIALGASDPVKGHAVASWVGDETTLPEGALWRLNVVRDASVKVDVGDTGELTAKVHLYFRPRYVLW